MRTAVVGEEKMQDRSLEAPISTQEALLSFNILQREST